MSDGEVLNREFLAERDLRIFKMRQAGVSVNEIARRLNMTIAATNNAISRQLSRLNREAFLAYPEVLRLELERLDNLQAAIWPMTQHRRVTLDDGTTVDVEPDIKAIQQVLSIMDRRTKLLGMESTNINVNVEGVAPPTPVLAGAEDGPIEISAFNPETEARKLIELMGSSGVLDESTVNALLDNAIAGELEAPVDAEIVDK